MTEIATDRVVGVVVNHLSDPSSHPESTPVRAAPADTSVIDNVLEDELVEDVSIDGMCGVY